MLRSDKLCVCVCVCEMPELQQRLGAAMCGLMELQVRRDQQEVLVHSALSLRSSEEEKQNPVSDVCLVSQLQHLQLRLDEQESHDQTDSSGFYELSDSVSGSLSNSSGSAFSDCLCTTNDHDQRILTTECSATPPSCVGHKHSTFDVVSLTLSAGGGASNHRTMTCDQEPLHISPALSPAPPPSEGQSPNSNPGSSMMTSQQSVHSYIIALLRRHNHQLRTGKSGPLPLSHLKPCGSPKNRTSLRAGRYDLGSSPFCLRRGGANKKLRSNRSESTHLKFPCRGAETKTRQSSNHSEVPHKGGGDSSQKRLKKPRPLSKRGSTYTTASRRVTLSRQCRSASIPEQKAPPTEMLDSVGGGASRNEHRLHCQRHSCKSRTAAKKKSKCLWRRFDDVMGSDSASLFRSTAVETSGDECSTETYGVREESAQEVRKTPLKAFVKIKASHTLKQKILRFRTGPLRLMTTM